MSPTRPSPPPPRLASARAPGIAPRPCATSKKPGKPAAPDPDQTLNRSWLLLGAVMSQDRLFDRDRRLVASIERVLRQLVRNRSDGRQELKLFAREARRPKDEDTLELERLKRDMRVWERLREGGPEVEAILERFRADWKRT